MGFPISTISSVAKILAQTFKIYFINGKTLIFMTLISSLIDAGLSLSVHLLATKPSTAAFPAEFDAQNRKAVADYVLHGLKLYFDSFKDCRIWSLTVASSFAYLLIAEATIHVSAAKLFGKSELHVMGLLSLARTRWMRPLFALFLKKLSQHAGALILLLTAYMLVRFTVPSVTILILVAVLTLIMTGLFSVLVYYVPFVCEEKSGFAALEKVWKLLKGSKIKVSLLNGLISILLWQFRSIYATPTNTTIVVLTLDAMTYSCVDVIWLVWLTVFYCESKKIHGEQEVHHKLSYAMKYSELPSSKSLL